MPSYQPKGIFRSIQATLAVPNEAAPSANDGVSVEDVLAITLTASLNGETFDGLGKLLAYRKTDQTGWRRAQRLDIEMSSVAGLDGGELESVEIINPVGRLAWVPSSVGVSGGVTMALDYVCSLRGKGIPG
jgi:hypothetical protein